MGGWGKHLEFSTHSTPGKPPKVPGPILHSVLGCAKPGHHPGPPPRAFSRGVGIELRPHPNLSPVLPNPRPSNRGFCLFRLLLFFATGVLFYLPGVVSHIFLFFSKTSVSFLSLFYFLFFVIALLLFFFFFLPYSVACGISVHGLEIRPELLWLEQRVRITGLTETVRPRGLLIGMRSPKGPHLNTRTWLCSKLPTNSTAGNLRPND